jgi:hypothetical protein
MGMAYMSAISPTEIRLLVILVTAVFVFLIQRYRLERPSYLSPTDALCLIYAAFMAALNILWWADTEPMRIWQAWLLGYALGSALRWVMSHEEIVPWRLRDWLTLSGLCAIVFGPTFFEVT